MTVANSSTGQRMIAWFKGSADRVVRTAIQTLGAYAALTLQAGGHLFNWTVAVSMVGLAVVASVVTQFLAIPSFGESWIFQVAERAVKTGLQTIAAGIGANLLLTDVDWDLTLHTALLAALASLATSALATQAGVGGQVDLSAPPPPDRSRSIDSGPRLTSHG